MAITDEDVRKIARLARLRLTPEEAQRLRGQLVKILDAMDDLRRLDTASVPPTSSVLGLTNALRDDEPRPSSSAETLLALAPAREGPYYKVPKVIE